MNQTRGGRVGLTPCMNSSAVRISTPLPATSRAVSPARRTFVERARKPASWVAVVGLAFLWTRLAPEGNVRVTAVADAAGLLAVIVAMLGRVWCAVYIAGRKNAELCQDGPYSLVRNPLYVFSLIGATGVALAAHRWGLVPAVIGAYLAYYHLVMLSEEARLRGLFPAAYPGYCAAVPRFFPKLGGLRSRQTLTLDPRDVSRALREVVWFPVAFVAVEALNRFL